MKLMPLILVFSAAYFCGSLRDKFGPSVDPPPPAANAPAPNSTDGHNHPTPSMISGGALNEKAKSLPQPAYPAAARAVRASGVVTVQIVVDENGKVVSASAIGGHPLLRPASEQAARKAEFDPTIMSGKAIKVSGTLTYNFNP